MRCDSNFTGIADGDSKSYLRYAVSKNMLSLSDDHVICILCIQRTVTCLLSMCRLYMPCVPVLAVSDNHVIHLLYHIN